MWPTKMLCSRGDQLCPGNYIRVVQAVTLSQNFAKCSEFSDSRFVTTERKQFYECRYVRVIHMESRICLILCLHSTGIIQFQQKDMICSAAARFILASQRVNAVCERNVCIVYGTYTGVPINGINKSCSIFQKHCKKRTSE